MEGITRIVSESLARHGFDRPIDYRRLQWSRWFRCESHHSLLIVPSKPGVFAMAEEIIPASMEQPEAGNRKPEGATRRMLAVTQFFEADDMAFVLDRMLSRNNPIQSRLLSGRYFIRYVVIEDGLQRRSICSSLNQWIASSGERASGIGSHFAASLNFSVVRTLLSAKADFIAENRDPVARQPSAETSAQLDSRATNSLHCPCPFPSGF